MVKFEVYINRGGKVVIDHIDDAECTPGMSRQYTRFNSECKPELLEYWNRDDVVEMNTPEYKSILARHNFKHKRVKFGGLKSDGYEKVVFFIDSAEP